MNCVPYWTPELSRLVGIIMPLTEGVQPFSARHALHQDLVWYVGRCVLRGFAVTDADIESCARRYLAGKRKISAPFTKTRKRAAAKARKAKAQIPAEVLAQIDYVLTLPMAQNVNDKSINALVGMVLKKHKYNPQVVKELLLEKLK